MIKNIISSFASALVDVQLTIAYSPTRELGVADITGKVKTFNKGIRREPNLDSLLSKRKMRYLLLFLKAAPAEKYRGSFLYAWKLSRVIGKKY